jgi:hypothetical protein
VVADAVPAEQAYGVMPDRASPVVETVTTISTERENRIARAVTHPRLNRRKEMALEEIPPDPDKIRDMFGPGQVDQSIRQAIQMCWMMLPKNKKNVDELERQMRRLMERAIKDMRKDINAFGLGDDS